MSSILFALVVLIAVLSKAVATTYPPPQQTFTASKYTHFSPRDVVGQSRLGMIDIQFTAADGTSDYIKMKRLDMVGDSKARGFAHGALLAHQIQSFTGPELDKYFAQQGPFLDLAKFPAEMQEKLQKIGKIAIPKMFKAAMAYVWEIEKAYTPQYLIDEMEAIADGMCSVLGSNCNQAEWAKTIMELNMLPEVIKMACTVVGAWGPATANNKLLQLRALDFGGGPWANNTIIQVHRGDPSNPDHAFVSVSWPAFVGVITGVAQNGVGISEKVWEVTGMDGMQPGTFNGEADIFVLRDMLQFAKTKSEAEAIVSNANRTWAIWSGVGSFADQKLDIIGYKQESAIAYTDVTMPSMTGQPFIDSVVYADKHTQPSWDENTSSSYLPSALQDFYGKIDFDSMKQIVQHHQTGDEHAAMYDFSGTGEMILAIGKINKDGNYGENDEWSAYNRPWCSFPLADLWEGK